MTFSEREDLIASLMELSGKSDKVCSMWLYDNFLRLDKGYDAGYQEGLEAGSEDSYTEGYDEAVQAMHRALEDIRYM